jgi:hypothetical protein
MRLIVIILLLPILYIDFVILCGLAFIVSIIFFSFFTSIIISASVGIPIAALLRLSAKPRSIENVIGKAFFIKCIDQMKLGEGERESVKFAIDNLGKSNPDLASWLGTETRSLIESWDNSRGSLVKNATKCLMTKVVLESGASKGDFPERVMAINAMVDDWFVGQEAGLTSH